MRQLVHTSVSFTLFLSAVVALGPLSTDMYLASFPTLVGDFQTTISEVQLTLSLFVVGIAVFQLIYGPLTDRFGRKPVLLMGLAIFIVSSLGCILATSIYQLILYRVLQSFGICAGIVVPRAMVRDLYEREQAARQFSRMGSIMGLAPAIAPIIGGYITVYFSWHGIFIFFIGYGVLLFGFTGMKIRESLPEKNHFAIKPIHIVTNYRDLFRNHAFVGYAITAALCFSGMFAFISGSSFVLIQLIGVPAENFGYYFGSVVLGYITGTFLGPKLSAWLGVRRTLQVGTGLTLWGGALMLVLWSFFPSSALAIVVPMIFYNMGVGIVVPQCQAGALAPFPEKAGAASAMAGFLLLGFSGVISMAVAPFYSGSALPMVLIILALGVTTFTWYSVFLSRKLELA
ncbi:multidrug effflux MFS transporter [Sneathiella sp.]|jgi:DHA1 family bicyclomycin/chloramphenicol resistance-like MFS transporter|uniref:multidrug effflux MFS transporter n=1 Tax=Sneathiella sp. TaxID=1964365 RepID=UPI0039E3CA01